MKKVVTHSRDFSHVRFTDGCVWLRGVGAMGDDMDLVDYIKQHDEEGYAEYDKETVMELMCDQVDSPLQLLYWLAVGFAEAREALKHYEER